MGLILGKYKAYLIIAIVIVVIILVIYIAGRRAGKKAAEIITVPLPTDKVDGKTLTTEEQKKIRSIADALYTDMNGINWNIASRDLSIYQNMSILSDTLFVGVYNDFNRQYSKPKDGYRTLKEWIAGERSFDSRWLAIANTLLKRFENLNLK